MAMKILHMGAIAAMTCLAAPIQAQSLSDDVHCLLVTNVFARAEKDPAKAQLAKAASSYYLGRVNVRLPAEKLRGILPAQAKTITPNSVLPTMNGCAKRFLQVIATVGTAPSKP